MDNYQRLLNNLHEKKPFALARFNDGEMQGIKTVGAVVARGDQEVSESLSEALRGALQHEQEGYWVGIPCAVCWPELRSLADSLIRSNYPFKTSAVVLTNRNWRSFVSNFPSLIGDRKVSWVSGNDQRLDNLNFKVSRSITVNTQDAWQSYSDLRDCPNFEKGSIVILSCGPLARVLVKDWFKARPDLTIIDAGSIWDPFTRGVRHRCHTGQLPPCRGCN